MANDIIQDFLIHAPASKVFHGISTPEGLDTWWTQTSSRHGNEFDLGFGPGYEWRARIVKSVPDREFELELTRADDDWTGTKVGFVLEGDTQVRFHHTGWPRSNDHYRISCYCWAMYLRLLKRYVERGEVVPYDRRLEA
ncbi:MAG TPA: SRPBCC domain-containing protein [Gemmatimonadaceae bacterium]|nr:SRPBCC domain-containing protein [Gemmatimonadaceae bacterium]